MFLRNLLAAGLLAATAPALAADTYVIDPTHAQVEFTYSHFGFSNITGRFDRIEGSIVHDAEDPANSSVQASIAIDSVSTGVADLDEHLRGSDFFDAGSHPVATFQSTAVKAVGEGRLEVTGDLSIHGVTQPVVMDVNINKIATHPMTGKPAAGFDASFRILRSEFGVGGFAPAVSDEVLVEITVEAQQAEDSAAAE